MGTNSLGLIFFFIAKVFDSFAGQAPPPPVNGATGMTFGVPPVSLNSNSNIRPDTNCFHKQMTGFGAF
jgi:hypothetical protein